MKHLLFISLLFLPCFSFGQNLISNPSFEEPITCLTDASYECFNGEDQILKCIPPWHYGTCASADYFNACDSLLGLGVPSNVLGYQEAKTGLGYVGLFAQYKNMPNYREYVTRQLDITLIAGVTYYAEVYVSLTHWTDTCGVDGMGLHFSANHPDTLTLSVLPVTPQISNPTGNLLTDTVNWMKISGTFIAVGGENYVSIGNFLNDSTTQGCESGSSSYYWVDDVLLMEDTASGIEEKKITAIKLYPNPTSGKFTVSGAAEIQVYDLFGRLVLETPNKEIDMSSFSKGLYFIRVGEATSKLVIQ